MTSRLRFEERTFILNATGCLKKQLKNKERFLMFANILFYIIRNACTRTDISLETGVDKTSDVCRC